MRLFSSEIFKIFSRSGFLFAFTVILVINGFLIYYNEIASNKFASPAAYQKIYDDYKKLPEDKILQDLNKEDEKLHALEIIEMNKATGNSLPDSQANDNIQKYIELFNKGGYLRYTNNIINENSLFQEVTNDFKRITGYKDYINSIETQAENMKSISIFSNQDSFDYRNIQKTAQAFLSLKSRALTFDISKGVNMATNFIGTDLLFLLLIFYVCLRLITFEKEKGLFALVKPAFKGRGSLIVSKIATVAVSAIVFEVFLYAENFVIAGKIYGFGDLSRTIQSVEGFTGCILPLNVYQYLILYLAVKAIACVLSGFMILYICNLMKTTVSVYVTVIAVFGLEYIFNTVIPRYAALSVFKYMNIAAFLKVTPVLGEYVNMNVLGYPINVIPASIIIAAVSVTIFVIATINLFKYQCGIQNSQLPAVFNRIRFPGGGGVSVFGHESFKLFVSNRAWLILLVIFIVQAYSYNIFSYYISSDDFYYKSYMQQLEGPVTQGKKDFIQNEQKRYDDLNNTLMALLAKGTDAQDPAVFAIEMQLVPRNAFQKVLDRYDYINEQSTLKGASLWFVYDGGYERLFGISGYNDDLASALILILTLIGCISAVFAMEYSTGVNHIISSYYKGRGHTMRAKICLSMIICIPAFLISYLPDFLNIFRYYGFKGLYAPISSLPAFVSFPESITILKYIISIYSIRLIAAIIALMIILLFSQLTKNAIAAILVSVALLVSPLILSLSGVTIIDSFSLNSVLSGNMFLKTTGVKQALEFIIPVIIGCAAILIIDIDFCKKQKHTNHICKSCNRKSHAKQAVDPTIAQVNRK